MKSTEEIYAVRFNKAVLKDDIHFTMYTLGVPIGTAIELVIPTSIIQKEDKIIVSFNNNTKHIFFYNSDVELFTREIEKNGTDIDAPVVEKKTRLRKDTSKSRNGGSGTNRRRKKD